jgi:uncharacterized RmlC-like cupin family protein
LSRVFPAVIVLLALVLLPMIPVQANGSGTVVSISDATVGPGAQITRPINITNITNVGAITIWLCYNPTIVTIPAGGIADGNMGALAASSIDNITGEAKMTWFSATGETGDFVFAYVTLKAGNISGSSLLDIQVKTLVDTDENQIAHTVNNGTFTVMEGDATLEGHVSFPGRVSPPHSRWIEDFVVRFFQGGSEMAWSPINATTNNTGVFTITGVTPGTYNVSIKNWTCLSEVVTGVTLTAGNTTVVDFGTTREGDSNNDDWIVLSDRTILYTGWGSQVGDATWNAHCDFNRDGWLTLADRTIMYTYWAQHGDLVS